MSVQRDWHAPLETRGARIEFLEAVPWEVLVRCLPILRAFALEAPETVGGVIVVTSHLRPVAGRPSYHPGANAVDVRTGIQPGEFGRLRGAIVAETREVAIERARTWTGRTRLRLGDEFDVIGPPEPRHIDHLHGERDLRKASRSYL